MKRTNFSKHLLFDVKVAMLTVFFCTLVLLDAQERPATGFVPSKKNKTEKNADSVDVEPENIYVVKEQSTAEKTAKNLKTSSFADKDKHINEKAVAVMIDKKSVKYIYANGDIEIREGGTLPWRNKNPGAIRIDTNALGKANGFAVYESEQAGRQGIKNLLRGEGYRNLTLRAAVFKYAPPHENDTKKYQADLKRMTGLDLGKYLRDLTEEELEVVVSTIKVIEGWVPGKVTYINGPKIKQNMMNNLKQITK